MFIDTNTRFSFINFTTNYYYYGFLLTCCLMNTTGEKNKHIRCPLPHSESILIVILRNLTDCFPFSSVTTAAGADGLPGRGSETRDTHTKPQVRHAQCGLPGRHQWGTLTGAPHCLRARISMAIPLLQGQQSP